MFSGNYRRPIQRISWIQIWCKKHLKLCLCKWSNLLENFMMSFVSFWIFNEKGTRRPIFEVLWLEFLMRLASFEVSYLSMGLCWPKLKFSCILDNFKSWIIGNYNRKTSWIKQFHEFFMFKLRHVLNSLLKNLQKCSRILQTNPQRRTIR